jgi:RHH-type transcriptional regulator, rel operon repressor / antitoxin RelB
MTTRFSMLALRLPPEIEERLDALAKATGRTKSFYVREAILEHLEDMEDAYLAAATLERVRRGKERVFTTDQVRADLGLDD